MAAKPAQRNLGKRDASPPERIDLNYRQLRLVAGVQKGRGKAIAYQGGRTFLEAEAADASAAVEELKRLIDELHEQREAGRDGAAPTAEEYTDALLRINRHINAVQQSALVRHASRPGAQASLAQLSDQVGVSADALRRAYVKLGRYLGDILNFHPQRDELGKPSQPMLVLAEPVESATGEAEWALRPGLVAAIDSWSDRGSGA